MKRLCDNCGIEYNVRKADLDRGWGLTCSELPHPEGRGFPDRFGKSCAAKKREEARDDYDKETVENNNMKRKLWHNKYKATEMGLRNRNPNWSDEKIWAEMYKITKDEIFLVKNVTDIFIF